MTAKELLRQKIEALSEDDAAEALRLIGDQLGGTDPLVGKPDVAELETERLSAEDEVMIEVGRGDARAGRTVSLEELKSDFS